MGFVASVFSIMKPVTSREPAPRPTPNSNRPSERWSIIATRSATRTGWFTGGVMFQIAEPEMDPVGHAGQVGEEDLGGAGVRVLVEEVVLGDPDVLEAGLVGGLGQRDVVHERRVLEIGVVGEAPLGHVALQEDAELHGISSLAAPESGGQSL